MMDIATDEPQLAEAGWKYTPTLDSDDMATCAYCDLALDGWESGDKPMQVAPVSVLRHKLTVCQGRALQTCTKLSVFPVDQPVPPA